MPQQARGLVDRWFQISARGSSVAVEVKAGVVTFLTMSYILLVNPLILGEAGLPIKEVVTSTALTSAVASLGVGLFANLPVGIAPGMGLNAYLVYSQVLGAGVAVEVAFACCLTAAVLVAVLALIRALSLILNMVPDSIKLAVVVGMGLLLSFIGLQTAQVVVKDEETMVKLGDLTSSKAMLALMGLTLIATLHHHQVPGAIIIGIIGTAVGYFALENVWPHEFVAMPTLGLWKLDFGPVLALESSALSAVGAYALVMIFDIGGAMYGLGNLAGLVKDGSVPGAIATYLSAAAGTALGAFTGTTPLIIAAESAVGIKEGGRTGLVGVTVAACFALSLFLAPILQAVPPVATAPVLVLVGAMMMGEAGHINWVSMPTALPAFLTMVIQPFTFSIANGIYAGLIFSLLLYITTGQVVTHVRSMMRSSSLDLDSVEAGAGGSLTDPLLHGAPGHPTPPGGHSPQPPGGSPSAPVDFKRTSMTVASNIVRSLAHNAAASPLYAQTTHDLLIGTPSRPGFQQATHGYGSSGAPVYLDTSLQHPGSRPSASQPSGGTWS